MEALQRDTFNYFVHEANPVNGLIIDKTKPGTPASIAAVGLALSAYPVGVERGFMTRANAIERTLATLRFFDRSVQSSDPDATGYKGVRTIHSRHRLSPGRHVNSGDILLGQRG